MPIAIILIIASYLIGSIPFGLLISKHRGIDLREEGSGNIGTTNAVRVLGKKWGIVTGILDILKGTVIIVLIYILEACNLWTNPFVINGESIYVIYGIAAVIGHVFPVFLKFKGGKAVATSFGVLLATTPWSAFIVIITFAIVVAICGYVSLGSSIGALMAIPASFIIYQDNLYSNLFMIIMVALIIYRHIGNYKKLLNGTERCFKKKK